MQRMSGWNAASRLQMLLVLRLLCYDDTQVANKKQPQMLKKVRSLLAEGTAEV
jgi:hypothetical protein